MTIRSIAKLLSCKSNSTLTKTLKIKNQIGEPVVKKDIQILIVLLILLLGGIYGYLSLVFDRNDLRQQLVDSVKEQTGHDLTIEGEIDLTFFAWLGVTTGAVELSNAPEFSPDVFASTQKVSIRVKLVPLLSKNGDGHYL